MTFLRVPLGDLTTLQAGYGFPVELQGRTSGDLPFAKVGDISRCGRSGSSELNGADHYVDVEELVTLRAKSIPAGSILFAKIGEAIRQNHRVIAAREMLIDNNAMAAIPGERINGKFLYHFLRTVDFYALAPATTVPALRKSDLEKLAIPLPALPEQRRIAAILDQADAVRAKRREALAQLDKLAQAIFVEMFGDPASNPKEWPIVRLVDYIADVTNGITRRGNEAETGNDIVLRLRDIRADAIDFSDLNRITLTEKEIDKYCVLPGELLFIRVNGNPDYVGRCALFEGYEEPVYFNDHVMRVRLKRGLVGGYLAHFLNGPEGKREVAKHRKTSAGQHTINQGGLGSICLALPNEMEQMQFVERIREIRKCEGTLLASLHITDTLFDSLQHRAFRGEL